MSPSNSGAEVRAPLTFIVPQDTKPCFHSSALTGGLPKVFFETEERMVTIRDMRPLADGLSLDRHGFELRHHETAVDDLYDDAAVEEVYRREIEALLTAATGADRVVVSDHTRPPPRNWFTQGPTRGTSTLTIPPSSRPWKRWPITR